jgi:subtilisin family serine protease
MKIGIIDSGIHPGHPHVGHVAGAIHLAADGPGDDPLDRLGHGTAAAAAIREKAPDAELYSVKVFDRRLSTQIEALVRALLWCREHGMDIINLSLGTANPAHADALIEAVKCDALVVSAADMLPGSLPGVIGVAPDDACPRDRYRFHQGVFYASPYPRPIPSVPRSRNLYGISFAVANMTGLLAQMLDPVSGSWAAQIACFRNASPKPTNSEEYARKIKALAADEAE